MIQENEDIDVNILLTSACNQRCPFCFAIDHIDKVAKENIISESGFNKILAILNKDSLKHVNLIGGEPSLHPLAGQFINQLLEERIGVGFSTNALWNADFREYMKNFRGMVEYEVTLHAKNFYSERNLARLEETLESLGGEKLSLGFTITDPVFDYSHHIRLAKKYGFDIRWSLAEPTVEKSNRSMGYRSIGELQTYGNKIFSFVEECAREEISTWLDLEIPRCAFSEEQVEYFRKSEDHDVRFRCPPFLDIGADLSVWKCFPLSGIEIRHLDDFKGIRDAYNYFVERFSSLEMIGTLDGCTQCDMFRKECAGGSKIIKYLRMNDSDHKT